MIDARQTMMIKASITAYSTAVGPSSEARKRRTLFLKVDMAASFNDGRKVKVKIEKEVTHCIVLDANADRYERPYR